MIVASLALAIETLGRCPMWLSVLYAPLSGDAFTIDKTQSSRAPPDGSPEMADRGIAHAATSDALITYAARLTDRHDAVFRRLERRNRHGLN